eukprot:TRINITY_DN21505_c0_g1_i6.p1 TRINITY_DN21505_c0_g1~~TRINITY_DN21505_c0_g1_i6.p1  ORF type:complete len:381 (+),score=66.47 TRINITY_DN21505_c0_g1_i6:474-1616(+)
MGPKTRSMAQDNLFIINNVEQISHTLDPIQKKIVGITNSMPFWRYTLYHRYVGKYCPRGLITSWKNYGARHKIYNKQCDVVSFTSPIPSDLQQSTLKIGTVSDKLLTVHIYYTTGIILVQGKACRDWVDSEFKKLRAIVHTLATSGACPDDGLAISRLHQSNPTAARGTTIMSSGSIGMADDDTLSTHGAESACEQEGAVIPPYSTSNGGSAAAAEDDALSAHTAHTAELACDKEAVIPPTTSDSESAVAAEDDALSAHTAELACDKEADIPPSTSSSESAVAAEDDALAAHGVELACDQGAVIPPSTSTPPSTSGSESAGAAEDDTPSTLGAETACDKEANDSVEVASVTEPPTNPIVIEDSTQPDPIGCPGDCCGVGV